MPLYRRFEIVEDTTPQLGGTLDLNGQSVDGTLTLIDGQAAFPATQNPSSDANTLDDYEEGSWTPTITFGGSATGVTYNNQTAIYQKVGKWVSAIVQIILSNKGSSSGDALINGLPFSVDTVVSPISVSLDVIASGLGDQHIQGWVSGTDFVPQHLTGTGIDQLDDADFSNGTRFRATVVYQTGG